MDKGLQERGGKEILVVNFISHARFENCLIRNQSWMERFGMIVL